MTIRLVQYFIFFSLLSFQLNAGDNKFTYKCEPIHPLVVAQFEGGFNPATERNAYYSDNKIDLSLTALPLPAHPPNEWSRKDYIIISGGFNEDSSPKKTMSITQPLNQTEYIRKYNKGFRYDFNSDDCYDGCVYYRWLGQLTNGYHVVFSSANWGGSGSISGIKVLEFSNESGIDYLVFIDDIYGNPDKVEVKGNRIIIEIEKNKDAFDSGYTPTIVSPPEPSNETHKIYEYN